MGVVGECVVRRLFHWNVCIWCAQLTRCFGVCIPTAIAAGDSITVKKMIRQGYADLNSTGPWNSLRSAVQYNQSALVVLLLRQEGIDVNIQVRAHVTLRRMSRYAYALNHPLSLTAVSISHNNEYLPSAAPAHWPDRAASSSLQRQAELCAKTGGGQGRPHTAGPTGLEPTDDGACVRRSVGGGVLYCFVVSLCMLVMGSY